MKKLTFRGGVHPNDSKAATAAVPIKELEPSDTYTYPLSQHIGAPCKPLVGVGDAVLRGQKIADAESFVTAPIHSAVSGRVTAIERRMVPNGNMEDSIIIESDGQDALHESVRPHGTYESVTPEQILEIVREAGITGMGGAAFPTHVKLNIPRDVSVDTVIINGAECEPYLTSDHRVMLEIPSLVVEGLRLAMKAVGVHSAKIAIEENKPDAIVQITNKASKYKDIEICTLRTKYPQGSEKHLIKAVTGREVPSGQLPSSVGVIVLNIDTAVAIARAVYDGLPLLRRIVTVSGGAIKNPCNFSVKLGTPVRCLIEQAGGFSSEPVKMIAGGPMMGMAISSLDVPVTKGVSAILAFDRSEALAFSESPCTRCGRCIKACPMGLTPAYMNKYIGMNDYDAAAKIGLMDCIECGACSYICPCKRQLVQSFRLGKQLLQNRKKKQKGN